ncbi:MAG: DNA-3-methyladenine glycosylase 2 family protein, partial [Pseudomonadota bacterium]
QQVSVAAARAIWGRVCAAGADDPVVFHRLTDAAILDFGFSRPKLRYARAICAANMDFETLVDAPDDVVFDRLTAITGIGPWTAQIYLMSCLGRVDIFPAADLALQEATRHLLNTTDRPNTRLMTHIAKDWAPYRSIAARALWADYAILKKKDGVV